MPESHVARLFPIADPANGYMDYLRAADLVDNDEMRQYVKLARKEGFGWKYFFRMLRPSMTRRRLVQRFRKVPDLIVEGNRKPFKSPHAVIGATRDFPEIQALRNAGRVLDVCGAVAFEDFDQKRGTRLLVELLEFGDRIGRDTVFHNLVGQSLASFALRSFSEHVEAIPAADREPLIERIQDLILRPTLAMALEGEKRFSLAGLQPDAFEIKSYEIDSPQIAEAKEKLRAADPSFREQVRQGLEETIGRTLDELVFITKRPEIEWLKLLATNEPPHLTNLAAKTVQEAGLVDETTESFVQVITQQSVAIWIDSVMSPLRVHTRLRMLALQILVDNYRRKNGAPPTSLNLVPGAALNIDPFTGGELQYLAGPREAVIWSLGGGKMKPFGLDNQVPAHVRKQP